MSGEQRRPEAPQGPPWSLDLLADLHAGVLDDATAEQLRQEVAADPEGSEILAALDATSADLADLPPLTIPDDVATRIDAALENEVRAWTREHASPDPDPAPGSERAPDNVVDLASRRRRRLGWGGGLLAAAAAITGIVVVPPMLTDDTTNEAGKTPRPTGPPPLALQGGPGGQVTLDEGQFAEVMGSDEYLGALSDPATLLGCLQANGVNSGKPMGAKEVQVDGRPAQVFILSSGQLAQFRLLTVGPDCGPDNPATISDSTIGR